jgi:hypothetical protein
MVLVPSVEHTGEIVQGPLAICQLESLIQVFFFIQCTESWKTQTALDNSVTGNGVHSTPYYYCGYPNVVGRVGGRVVGRGGAVRSSAFRRPRTA